MERVRTEGLPSPWGHSKRLCILGNARALTSLGPVGFRGVLGAHAHNNTDAILQETRLGQVEDKRIKLERRWAVKTWGKKEREGFFFYFKKKGHPRAKYKGSEECRCTRYERVRLLLSYLHSTFCFHSDTSAIRSVVRKCASLNQDHTQKKSQNIV